MTLHGAGGTKKTVQVEVRKRKVMIDPQEIKARRMREEEEKRRLEEAPSRKKKTCRRAASCEAARREEEERRSKLPAVLNLRTTSCRGKC